MVDSFNTPGTEPAEAGVVAAPKSGMGGLFSSTAGKILIGVVVVIGLVGALAAILMIFVLGPDSANESGITPPATVTTTTVSVETSPTERPADDWADTFAFRNVFQPTMKVVLPPDPTLQGDGTGSGTDTDGTSSDMPADTLFLSSISTVDGVQVANLLWNGVTYNLEEGQSIPDTPWQVLSISGDTVVMLFGDGRITLTAGQGISK